MVEDIRALVRVDSVKGEAYPGAPFGSGPAAALDTALALAGGRGSPPGMWTAMWEWWTLMARPQNWVFWPIWM